MIPRMRPMRSASFSRRRALFARQKVADGVAIFQPLEENGPLHPKRKCFLGREMLKILHRRCPSSPIGHVFACLIKCTNDAIDTSLSRRHPNRTLEPYLISTGLSDSRRGRCRLSGQPLDFPPMIRPDCSPATCRALPLRRDGPSARPGPLHAGHAAVDSVPSRLHPDQRRLRSCWGGSRAPRFRSARWRSRPAGASPCFSSPIFPANIYMAVAHVKVHGFPAHEWMAWARDSPCSPFLSSPSSG